MVTHLYLGNWFFRHELKDPKINDPNWEPDKDWEPDLPGLFSRDIEQENIFIIGLEILNDLVLPENGKLDNYQMGKNSALGLLDEHSQVREELKGFLTLNFIETLTSLELRQKIFALTNPILVKPSINDFSPHCL